MKTIKICNADRGQAKYIILISIGHSKLNNVPILQRFLAEITPSYFNLIEYFHYQSILRNKPFLRFSYLRQNHLQIFDMQGHQHGPNCRHGPGHNHGHGQSMHGMPHSQPQQSPEQYFKSLNKKWSENRVFFWQEVLHGVVLDRTYEKFGLDFMRALNCQFAQMLIHSIQSMVSFDWIPFRLKPIVSGLFFPLAFLLFFNYNVVVGVEGSTNEQLYSLSMLAMILYLLVAIRSCSSLNSEQSRAKTKQVYAIRPYIQNPQMSCTQCGIVRVFRAFHCPFCKTCVPKHSRHSIVWGSCIGASNQLLAMGFFLILSLVLGDAIYGFYLKGSYGIITKVMFYLLNGSLCWISTNEFLQLFIFNLVYGATEQELKTWPMQQYLQKIPSRQFSNNVDQGFFANLMGSFMACFGIKGYQSQQGWGHARTSYPAVEQNRRYLINWAKAFIYVVPQLPFHKSRTQILEMMQREEPRMIEMFKLQTKFKEEVLAEAAGQHLNEFQLQQKVAQKMQAHMMRNMPPMGQMGMPSPDQQRVIQLQMLNHMKREFVNEPELGEQVQNLIKKLETNSVTPIEANMTMRQIQQELMKKRMQKVMKQATQQKLSQKQKNEQQSAPMRQVADQDL